MESQITATTRRRIAVQGVVQGVGFRPFVYGLALRLGLAGSVLNDSSGVVIEVEGTPDALDAFQRALREEAPPLARIDALAVEPIPVRHETGFTIARSAGGAGGSALIPPDIATCADCLRELSDPADRRHGYPFVNCTNCGPRFTIVRDVPYDRHKTTMDAFPLCPVCQAEYDDPLNRRFFAQPNACPVCGPRVRLVDERGVATGAEDPIASAARRLATGAIVALKGPGGYQLLCDGLDEGAVRRLRWAKGSAARPFALLVPDLETARQFGVVDDAEAALLEARQRPIVVLERRSDRTAAPSLAPSSASLGVQLPSTPLHHLLVRAYLAAAGPQRAALAVTSGNPAGEPTAYRDDDARRRVFPMAAVTLVHDRDICAPCDDSIVRLVAGEPQTLRRSLGYVPEPVALPLECLAPTLALGSHLESTICVARGSQAFIGPRIGDLGSAEAGARVHDGIAHMLRLLDVSPETIAYELHGSPAATEYALRSAVSRQLAVQHHHAHLASVLGEHGLVGPVIGVAVDGGGPGADGATWGCEVMLAGLQRCDRVAHLAYVPGDRSPAGGPGRAAAAYLHLAYGDDLAEALARFPALRDLLAGSVDGDPPVGGATATSSLARLFEAVADLVDPQGAAHGREPGADHLGDRAEVTGEIYPYSIVKDAPATLDVRATIRALVADVQRAIPVPLVLGRVYGTVAEMLAEACERARATAGADLNRVALGGDMLGDPLLLEQLMMHLERRRFQVYINRRVPPNDGGLSYGQAVVCAATLRHPER